MLAKRGRASMIGQHFARANCRIEAVGRWDRVAAQTRERPSLTESPEPTIFASPVADADTVGNVSGYDYDCEF
jgi:hypothetical protein